MEAKLKSLKVADLKEICTRASLATTTRSTKADLVTKILASQAAIDAYNSKYQQFPNSAPLPKSAALSNNDDILVPPEEVDWTLAHHPAPVPAPAKPTKTSAPTQPVPISAKPQSKVPPPKTTPAANEVTKTTVLATPVDEELEKRKARAARFGIALVEPPKPKTKSSPASPPTTSPSKTVDDPVKLKARSERFGVENPSQTKTAPVSATSGRKRSAGLSEEVDPEEQERRRKRAERFGNPVVGAKA
ncbi:hypothetical protein BGW80DRAFT_1314186 [Lactifluus volemus]|nr:hypothetical protein BGW80DRAFT_1314186 [Lactifluus volemus]